MRWIRMRGSTPGAALRLSGGSTTITATMRLTLMLVEPKDTTRNSSGGGYPAAIENRILATMSTSASTIRTLHARPSPPHSPSNRPPTARPSPPRDPSPPPEPHPHLNAVEETLIIPSLTLPALLIGPHTRVKGPRTRLLVLGRPDVAATALFADDPDALDANAWVDEGRFRVLRASAQWRSNSNARGAERHNVELVALGKNIQQLDIPAIENRILEPFRDLSVLLAPPLLSSLHEEELLTALLSGPEVPLYTALLIVLPSPISYTHPFNNVSSQLSTCASTLRSLTVDSTSTVSRSTSASASAFHAAGHAAAPRASLPESDIGVILDTLRRLVPVVVLAPEPVPANHPRFDSQSRSDADSDEEEDEGAPPTPESRSRSHSRLPLLLRRRNRRSTSPSSCVCPRSARMLCAVVARGGGDPYAKVDVTPPESGYLHDPHANAPRGDQDPAPLPRLAVHLRRPRAETEKARAHFPFLGAYGYAHQNQNQKHVYAYRNVRADADPLHLPSLLALAREVVRAWGVSSGSRATGVKGEYRVEDEYEEDSERDGEGGERGARRRRRGGTGWGRVGAFVAGVLLGVGVGVWAAAGVGAGVWEGVLVVTMDDLGTALFPSKYPFHAPPLRIVDLDPSHPRLNARIARRRRAPPSSPSESFYVALSLPHRAPMLRRTAVIPAGCRAVPCHAARRASEEMLRRDGERAGRAEFWSVREVQEGWMRTTLSTYTLLTSSGLRPSWRVGLGCQELEALARW
ncbi:hypothetical protein K438DRAFT_2032156 [Mycena galopus ATCC 62051]|nr:hypothetical protein K438DRAFT_2032156 [Mycena galopus ATCC 62051]